VAIVGVSMVIAIWRGFIWETLSIISWAAAALAAIYFGSAATHYLAHWISTTWIAYVAGYGLVFLVVLIPLSFASYRLSAGVKDSPIGFLDRFLGGVFGIVRGLALIGGLYLLFSVLVPPEQQPKSLHDARLLPVIRSSAQVLASLAPVGWHIEEKLEPHRDVSSPLQSAVNASGASGKSRHRLADKPYGISERRALDRLIEATGSSGTVKP
jgi:membrane protein required for colicin V production